MTLTELKAAVVSLSHRDDLTSQLDTFIALAEERLSRVLRLNATSSIATITILAGGSSVALPADYIAGRALTGSDGEWTQCTPEQLVQRISAGSNDKAYSVVNGSIRIPFSAGADIDLTLAYWTRVPALTALAPSNWLSINNAGVYLYATLCEVAFFAQDVELQAMAESRMKEAVEDLRGAEIASAYFSASIQADYVV